MGAASHADLSDGLPAAAHDQPHLAAGDADHLGHLLALDPGLEADREEGSGRPTRRLGVKLCLLRDSKYFLGRIALGRY